MLPQSDQEKTTVSDEQQIRELTQQWVAAWDIGDQPFAGELFRDLFAPGKNGIEVFDNIQGDVTVLTSVDEYVSTWAPFMEPLTHWSVRLDDLKVQVGADLAVTTFKLVGIDTRGPDGETIPFGQYGTHVWKKLPGLNWRIVHEHFTSYDVTKSES
jgi:ketosteroid isomerase-like protein